MPNNLNIHSYRSFSLYGITIAFFAIQLSKLVLVKTLLLLDCIENLCYEEIVWRQLEFAFFGALTPVGALFVFTESKNKTKRRKKKMKLTKLLSAILALCLVLTLFVACDSSDSSNPTNNVNQGQQTEKEPEKETEKRIEVNNIFLSKGELTLGIGETANLIATVSPGNVETTLMWSSSDDSVAEVSNQGEVTAKSEGDAVIKVEAPSGVLAVCNVTVKIKTGKVTGTVTYKYNDYVGNKADTGAKVILVSKSVTSLPDSLGLGMISELPEGCYGKKVDGSGNYTFDNVPTGEYYLIIISANTNENMDRVTGYNSWGGTYSLFSDKGKEHALRNAKLFKTRTTSITVSDGQTTTYSYDFGITYI